MAASIQLNLDKGMTAVGFLSALVDSNIVDRQLFLSELKKTKIFDSIDFIIKNEYPQGKKATRVVIIDTDKLQGKISNRSLKDVIDIIESSGFDAKVKSTVSKIFENYANSWQETNSQFLLNEYFDNVSIMTVISICLYLHLLDSNYLYASRINLGSGIVISSAQAQKVPRDIVKHLLSNFATNEGSREGELIDPIFAALLSMYLRNSKVAARGSDVKVCYGLGDKDYALYDDFYKILITVGQNINEENDMINFESKVSNDPIRNVEKQPNQVSSTPLHEQETFSNVNALSKKIEAITTLMDELDHSLRARKSKLNEIQDANLDEEKANLNDEEVLRAKREIKIDTAAKAPLSNEVKAASEKSESYELLEKIRNLEEKLIQTSKNRQALQPENATIQKEIEKDTVNPIDTQTNHIIEITSNIDNSTGEELGFLAELMMANNAYDVYFEPIFTNSFKPAYKITAIIDEKDLVLFSKLILLNSGAALVKYATFSTIEARSKRVTKAGKFGEVAFNRIEGKGDQVAFEEKKRIAQKYNLPLKQVEKILGEDYE